ncbi:hypothetical protein [Nostoc sp.]|uniref:hypothetical protein n=1 Tax=Nostoc sp. TaxID=1180 RepID=UPI002FEEB15D
MRIERQKLIEHLQGFSTKFVAFRDIEGELFIGNFSPKGSTLYVRLDEEPDLIEGEDIYGKEKEEK